MELLDVVDENGNKTGQVLDRDKVHELNLFHWEICVFVVNDKKQVLIQKRSATKKLYPNFWGLCAGHVGAGENIDVSALRELEEEIGLKCKLEDLKVLDRMYVRKRPNLSNITRYYYVYSDKKEDEFVIQEEEVSEVKWIDIDELIEKINNNEEDLALNESYIGFLEQVKEI